MNEQEIELLDVWASERGWTKSHAVRMAIRALIKAREEDPLLKSSGMIEGLPDDLSIRIDDYLKETFIAEKAVSGYRKRRRQQ
jgi:hypothetical protein